MDSSNGDAGDLANSIQNHHGSGDNITEKVATPSREDRLKRLRAKSELEIERRHNEIIESNKASHELRQRLQEERRQKIEQLKQREEERKRRVEERRQQLQAEERARSEQLQRRTQEREARMSVSVQMQPQPPSRKCRPAEPQMTRSCVATVSEAPASQRHAGCFMPCQRASLTRVKGVLAWGPPREPVRSKGGASTSWWLPGAVRSHASTPSGLDRTALRSPSSAPLQSPRAVKAASMRYLGPTIASANQNKGRQEPDSPRGRASSTAGSERASLRSVSQSARPVSEAGTVSMATSVVKEARTVSKTTKEAGVVPKATKTAREAGTVPRATKTTREVLEAGTVPKVTVTAPALKAALGGPSPKKAPSKGLVVSPRQTTAPTDAPPSPAPAKAKEGPETSAGVVEEERVATEENQKEAYRAKMAEQRRLAREARERQEEEQRRAEEEARARMEAERERMEVEARQIAAEEAKRQRLLREEAEAEEERLRAEEEADRLQKAAEEESRRARVAAEDEQRQERRRQVDNIMSRLKRPEEGDGPAQGVAGAPGTDGEAPQFKSRLLRSMLGSGRLAVASSGSLAGQDIQDSQEAPLAHSRSCHGGLGQMAADLGLRGRHSSLHDSLIDENGLGDDDGGPRLAGDTSVATPGLPLELLS